MGAITISDDVKAITIKMDAAILGDDPILMTLQHTLQDLNAVCPIATCGFSASRCSITLKDARTFSAYLNPGLLPSMKSVSGDFWTPAEDGLVRAVIAEIKNIVATKLVSNLTVTYV